ncbi:ribosomal protein L37E [Nocardiopsis mwathae]|uniref:Ribosomal protein L37E n=1 Tax=Nocardiopsis mwathae TaxID=1472723 RepID=A0A7X0D7G4_9ACTN|nr:hypothetical protein [Nocardiopsis mwathae]MBB6173706.1 ribosomal protein L37E [Nocardiopsis mwathae]
MTSPHTPDDRAPSPDTTDDGLRCEVPDCDDPLTDDAPVCAGCGYTLAIALHALHGGPRGNGQGLDTELELAAARQSRTGESNMGRRSAETAVAFDERASETVAVVRNTLSTWVRLVHGEVGGRLPDDTLGDMARWLERFIGWIRRSDFGGECVDEIVAAVRLAERTVDRPEQKVFAGECRRCGAPCYARPESQRARCGSCGAEHGVRAERERILRDAADRLVTAADAARALRAVGYEITDAMVRGYARRGHIRSEETGSAGRPLYRLGDVLDIALPDSAA